MHNIADRIYEGILAALYLQMAAMVLVDFGQFRYRIKILTGKAGRGFPYLSGPAVLRTFWMLWPAAVLIQFLLFFLFPERPSPHPPPASQSLTELALFLALMFLVIFLASEWSARRWSLLAPFSISRGKLMNDVRVLTAKERHFSFHIFPLSLFVLPDSDFARNCSQIRRGIVIPRSLLEQMSANAIKWLAAFQYCLQSDGFSDPVFWPTLSLNITVAVTIFVLRVKATTICLILLSLLAIEDFVIVCAMPRLLLRAQVKAIGLSGYSEAFFSAQGILNRFGGAPLAQPTLLDIGRRTGITPERITALLGEQTAPPEERYATTGSYLETGLP